MRRLTLAGSTTVITGAASGMGAEIARLLAAARIDLALIDRDAEALASLAAGLPGRVTTHVVDLSEDAPWRMPRRRSSRRIRASTP